MTRPHHIFLLAVATAGSLAGCMDTHRGALLNRRSSEPDEPEVQLVIDKPGWFKKYVSPAKAESVARRESSIAVRKVSLDGHALLLGQDGETTLTTDQFSNRVRDLVTAQKHLSAAVFVQQFPDICQRVLQDGLVAEKPDLVLLAMIARIHDEHTGSHNRAWSAAVGELKTQPERFAEFAAARRAIYTSLTTGQALPRTRPLPDLLPRNCSAAWQIDAWTLTGMLRLLDEKPQDAGQAFAQAVDLAAKSQPYVAMQIELLLSDSVRRDGLGEAASDFWQSASRRGAALMNGRANQAMSSVLDPQFWDRAAYLRPNQSQWPEDVAQAFVVFHQQRGWPELNESPECLLWSVIGHARLDRHDSQGALVAFKKSESLARSPVNADRWQIAQAKALVGLGQSAAATALLMKHVEHQDPGISQPALALLGTIKLQSSQATVGLALLRKAHETFPDAIWPGQMEARADLGLACLMCGDEASGLRELHSVQQLFEQRGDVAQLLKLLNNEAAWHDARKQRDESDSLKALIAQVEASFAPQP